MSEDQGIRIDIVVPADNFESARAIKAAAAQTRLIYIRFGKAPMHDLPRKKDDFVVGKARIIRELSAIRGKPCSYGSDVTPPSATTLSKQS